MDENPAIPLQVSLWLPPASTPPCSPVVGMQYMNLAFDDQYELVARSKDGTLGENGSAMAEAYALEVYREEVRRAEQTVLDGAIARSLYAEEEHKLLSPTAEVDSDDDDLVLVDANECKPPPSCTCCLAQLADTNTRRILPCGHLYCTNCIAIRCRMGVRDRSMVPAHCCKKEFPIEYVSEALSLREFRTYDQYMKEKAWQTLDLDSDRDYARIVRQHNGTQCPGCGIGVQRSVGCNRMQCVNHHEFCFACGRQWKTCGCSCYP